MRAATAAGRLLRWCLLLTIAAALASACTENPITGPPGEGIDDPVETVEVTLAADEFVRWRDTTFTGYALPTDAGFTVLADTGGFRARTLLRYGTVPDSVTVDSVRLPIEAYADAELRFLVDTAGSSIPPERFRLEVRGLERGYEPDEVTWERAAEGDPWGTPGGDLGRELGSLDLSAAPDSVLADTLVIPVGAASDSLLSDWAGRGGGEGAALLLEGPGTRLQVEDATLLFRAKPAGRDTLVRLAVVPFLGASSPITFVYDPPVPPPSSGLRIGGLPASRFYLEFLPPDTVDGFALTGGTINRAELVFRPLAAPPAPFVLEEPPNVTIIDLVGDPFVIGAKTPIGGALGSGGLSVEPDSLAAGTPVRFDFTTLMTRWAAAPDSFGSFTVGVRFQPDVQSLGFWDFGSVESDPALRPFVRIVLTPPSDFDIP